MEDSQKPNIPLSPTAAALREHTLLRMRSLHAAHQTIRSSETQQHTPANSGIGAINRVGYLP